MKTQTDSELQFTLTRVFDTPRDLVFDVWTREDHIAPWWGPKDFTTFHVQTDFRVGGSWRAGMRAPDGKEYWHRGEYREIVRPSRIVMTHSWEDEAGTGGHESLLSIALVEENGRTRLTLTQSNLESRESRESHAVGWGECLDRLGVHLSRSKS